MYTERLRRSCTLETGTQVNVVPSQMCGRTLELLLVCLPDLAAQAAISSRRRLADRSAFCQTISVKTEFLCCPCFTHHYCYGLFSLYDFMSAWTIGYHGNRHAQFCLNRFNIITAFLRQFIIFFDAPDITLPSRHRFPYRLSLQQHILKSVEDLTFSFQLMVVLPFKVPIILNII